MNDLSAEETRVLGCLLEKQLATPQQYPLTLNALTLACNQSSNRDPVVSYDEATVEAAITAAKTKGLARFVHPSHGRSAIRYAHMLGEALGLDARQLALLAVLMLRGPQTPGELRARTERMSRFDDLADLERELELLGEREDPLVVPLQRRPGQKEVRYEQLLGGTRSEPGEDTEHPTSTPQASQASQASPEVAPQMSPAVAPQVSPAEEHSGPGPSQPPGPSLERAVAELQMEVAKLRRELDDLRSELGA
ncbi:MAG: YceH family protein [Acidimicrobiales bacterium]